jgi:hypothetical protein
MAHKRKRPLSLSDAIGRAVTRKARPVPTGTAAENTRTLDEALGRRGTAERLGVSERTLRRWRAGGTPSKAHAERLAEEARTAREVRRQAIAPRREARLRNRGAHVRMTGMIGGTPGGNRRNWRQRTIGDRTDIHLSGEQMGAILDAWEAGDDEGAMEALRDALAEEYDGFASIKFEDLTQLDFLRDDPTE